MTDATLEEMWRIKEELSAPHLSWKEYANELYAFQETERKSGVKFVSFPPISQDVNAPAQVFVAEDGPEYGAKPAT